MLLSKEGYYRGVILDSGCGETSKALPQEILMLQAEDVYDIDSEEWISVDPEDGTEITWYGVLFGHKDQELANCKQLKKITGWDGANIIELGEMDFAGLPIQFRVEFNTHEEKTSLKVVWVDPKGASPFRSVPKLDRPGLERLQARYAPILAATRAPVAPASAPAKAKAPAKTEDKPKRTRRTKAEIEAEKAVVEGEDIPFDDPKPAPTKPAGRPQVPAAARPSTAAVGKCTADEAWEACATSKRSDVTNDQLAKTWTEATKTHSPDGDEAKATDETWFLIREDVLASTGKV